MLFAMATLAVYYGQYTRVEARGEDLDDREQYLRRGGAEGHQGQVGDGAVPHGHVHSLLLTVDRHLGTGIGVGEDEVWGWG